MICLIISTSTFILGIEPFCNHLLGPWELQQTVKKKQKSISHQGKDLFQVEESETPCFSSNSHRSLFILFFMQLPLLSFRTLSRLMSCGQKRKKEKEREPQVGFPFPKWQVSFEVRYNGMQSNQISLFTTHLSPKSSKQTQ